jgi:hypothetical protein
LAHAGGNAIRVAYNRAEYLDERRKMMQWYADYIRQQTSAKSIRLHWHLTIS